MANTRRPWDQLPDEDGEAYVRFLHYRNLGPTRSMRKAYVHFLRQHDGYAGDGKRLSAPGLWWGDYYRRDWRARATAWDLHALHTYGARVAVLHVLAVTRVAEKVAAGAKEFGVGDPEWPNVIRGLDSVGKFLNPELVDGIARRHGAGSSGAVPAPAGALPDPGDDRSGVA